MIDPQNITNYNRSEGELEEFLIFCILVAGKNSDWAAKKTDELMDALHTKFNDRRDYPLRWGFAHFRAHEIEDFLREHKTGQYIRLSNALNGAVTVSRRLNTVTVEDLTRIPGVGLKTARFFLVHSRREVNHAVLDTHVLKWLREQFPQYESKIPRTTPQTPSIYRKWENLTLFQMAEVYPRLTVAQADLTIWKEMRASQ